jgi:hypothetical protein
MLRTMGEVDDLIGAARALVRDLLRDLGQRLAAGADVERIHGYYLLTALRLLEEAETRAIVAAGGEWGALRSIERTLQALRALQDELWREFPNDADS